jgi:hypothetical protein
MVMPAELQEIVDRGFAAVRPVLDVMRVDMAAMGAAWKAATAVARL